MIRCTSKIMTTFLDGVALLVDLDGDSGMSDDDAEASAANSNDEHDKKTDDEGSPMHVTDDDDDMMTTSRIRVILFAKRY
jgi:hypothetical protein